MKVRVCKSCEKVGRNCLTTVCVRDGSLVAPLANLLRVDFGNKCALVRRCLKKRDLSKIVYIRCYSWQTAGVSNIDFFMIYNFLKQLSNCHNCWSLVGQRFQMFNFIIKYHIQLRKTTVVVTWSSWCGKTLLCDLLCCCCCCFSNCKKTKQNKNQWLVLQNCTVQFISQNSTFSQSDCLHNTSMHLARNFFLSFSYPETFWLIIFITSRLWCPARSQGAASPIPFFVIFSLAFPLNECVQDL